MLQLEMAAAAVLGIEPLKREGEQWQRVLCASGLDVGKKRVDQRTIEFECARRAIKPFCGIFDDLGIGPLRHRRETERDLLDAVQFLGELQVLVVFRSDRKQRDDRGRVVGQQVTQQGEEVRASSCPSARNSSSP